MSLQLLSTEPGSAAKIASVTFSTILSEIAEFDGGFPGTVLATARLQLLLSYMRNVRFAVRYMAYHQ